MRLIVYCAVHPIASLIAVTLPPALAVLSAGYGPSALAPRSGLSRSDLVPCADQGHGATAVAVLGSPGEPGKASPIRGGGRMAKRMRRCEPGKTVAV